MMASRMFSSESHEDYRDIEQVYLRIDKDGKDLGDIIIQLWYKESPYAVADFINRCCGSLEIREGFFANYQGTYIDHIETNKYITMGSHLNIVNEATDECQLVDTNDENIYDFNPQDAGGLQLSHDRRGLVSLVPNDEGLVGAEFDILMVPDTSRDGQNTIIGEVVEGHEILDILDRAGSADGKVKGDFAIIECGLVEEK